MTIRNLNNSLIQSIKFQASHKANYLLTITIRRANLYLIYSTKIKKNHHLILIINYNNQLLHHKIVLVTIHSLKTIQFLIEFMKIETQTLLNLFLKTGSKICSLKRCHWAISCHLQMKSIQIY
jgi:hypothetical protein